MGATGYLMASLTHFDHKGAAHMVDVSEKAVTVRVAVAKGNILMAAETRALIQEGRARKGDVLSVARLAGIMGAKKTPDLIPLCHPLTITKVSVDLSYTDDGLEIEATVKTTGQTGVEMEALTAVNVAALTVYDMVKAVDKTMQINNVRVVFKDGGKSGRFEAE
jgi:cyclic pyranopterin monophosphate synthase